MIKRYTLYAILYTLIFLAGCSGVQKSSATELVQPRTTDTLFAQKWVNVYGDSLRSVRDYNIALMLRIMNQQDARIKKLEEKIERSASVLLSNRVKKLEGRHEFDDVSHYEVMEHGKVEVRSLPKEKVD